MGDFALTENPFETLRDWLVEMPQSHRAVHHLFFNSFSQRWECVLGDFTHDHRRWRGEGETIEETVKIALEKMKYDNGSV
jgi:hypothetical protein